MTIFKHLINLRLSALLKVVKSTDSGVKFKKKLANNTVHTFSPKQSNMYHSMITQIKN